MVISLNSLPKHIFRSIVDKFEHKDLLQFAQANKFTDQYISKNASRLQNHIKVWFLVLSLENIAKLEQKQHFPGKIVAWRCDLCVKLGTVESEAMRDRFIKVCQRWRLETTRLVVINATFFTEAIRTIFQEVNLVGYHDIFDTSFFLYPEIQKLKTLAINRDIDQIPIYFMENCCCEELQVFLEKLEADELRVLLQRFISGSIHLSSWKFFVEREIDPSVFFTVTAGFDIKLYWKRGVNDLPFSHIDPLDIHEYVVAIFSLTNVKGDTVFVTFKQHGLSIFDPKVVGREMRIKNPENNLSAAWEIIRKQPKIH